MVSTSQTSFATLAVTFLSTGPSETEGPVLCPPVRVFTAADMMSGPRPNRHAVLSAPQKLIWWASSAGGRYTNCVPSPRASRRATMLYLRSLSAWPPGVLPTGNTRRERSLGHDTIPRQEHRQKRTRSRASKTFPDRLPCETQAQARLNTAASWSNRQIGFLGWRSSED